MRAAAVRVARPHGWRGVDGMSLPAPPLLRLDAAAALQERACSRFEATWLAGMAGGSLPAKPPGDYELSLGRIVETLRRDYPAVFERTPNFEIYDEEVVLELGQPLQMRSVLRGKRRYCRALRAMQHLACSTISEGVVTCRVEGADGRDHALRVPWTCRGKMRLLGLQQPVYISAVSLYSLSRQRALQPDLLSHKIHRHVIEFVEIEPPSLRQLLAGMGVHRPVRLRPVMAAAEGPW